MLKKSKMMQKRKQISLELKLDVLKRFKSGEKAVSIGRNLGLAPTTVRTICNRDANQITQLAKTATPLQSKQITKKRSPLMIKMESLLITWMEIQNQQNIPLSKIDIQNKALSIFDDIKDNFPSSSENVERFKASQCWFERFKIRANRHNKELNYEDLFSMKFEHALEEDTTTTNVDPLGKKLTACHISEAMQLISQGMKIFADNDPDDKRSLKVSKSIADALNCYKQIFVKINAEQIKTAWDKYFINPTVQPN